MSDPLGLSVGTTNLVAARVGAAPVTRRSVLTLFADRAPEVGELPGPNQPGLVLTGFVERVGDPVSLVASDGSSHRGETVLVEALDVMARTVGGGTPVTIAVPAHWGPGVLGALRSALRTKPSLSPDGVPATLIPDSGAALAGLRTAPGLPADGVVVLCDFGGGGTSITLADAGAGLQVIGETVRYHEFSGDLVDQSLLNHVVAGISDANSADTADTAAVGSLTRLREECRLAKERLSADTTAVIQAELPGYSSDVRITRPELERLMDPPLTGLLTAVVETLQRFRVPLANISAVATVGGGAAIPLVTQRLSEQLRAPVVTTPLPVLSIAAGAAVVAASGFDDDAQTGMAPTGLAPTMGWAAGAAPILGQGPPDGSSTFRALAWSQDDAPTGEPVPYAGADYQSDYGPPGARPEIAFAHDEEDDIPDSEPLPWYKRPPILFGAAAAAALLAISGLAVTLTSTSSPSGPVTETATSFSPGQSSPEAPPPEPTTSTITLPNGSTRTTVLPPPPVTTTPPTTATTPPTTTTSTTTTTTRTTTTTSPTTTTPPPTTTTRPPTTTAPPTTSAAPDPPDPPEPDPPDPPDPLTPVIPDSP